MVEAPKILKYREMLHVKPDDEDQTMVKEMGLDTLIFERLKASILA